MGHPRRRVLLSRLILAIAAVCIASLLIFAALAWRNWHITLAQYNTPQGPPLTPVWTAQMPFSVEQMQLAPDGRSIFLVGTSSEGCCENQKWHYWLAELDLAGSMLWQREIMLHRDSFNATLHIGPDRQIYLLSGEYHHETDSSEHMRLAAYGVDGVLRWALLDDDLSSASISRDKPAVAALTAGQACYGIGADGEVCWKYQVSTAGDTRTDVNPWPSPKLGCFYVISTQTKPHLQGGYVVGYDATSQVFALDTSRVLIWHCQPSSSIWLGRFRSDDSLICDVPAEEEDSDNGNPDPLISVSSHGQVEWQIKDGAGFDVTSGQTQDGRVYMRQSETLVCYGRDGQVLWQYQPRSMLKYVQEPEDGISMVTIRSAIELGSQVLCSEHHSLSSPTTGFSLIDNVLWRLNLIPNRLLVPGFHLLDDQGRQTQYFEFNSNKLYRTQAIVTGGQLIMLCDDFSEPRGDRVIEAYALPLAPATAQVSR